MQGRDDEPGVEGEQECHHAQGDEAGEQCCSSLASHGEEYSKSPPLLVAAGVLTIPLSNALTIPAP